MTRSSGSTLQPMRRESDEQIHDDKGIPELPQQEHLQKRIMQLVR
jgi:hypothetical protein